MRCQCILVAVLAAAASIQAYAGPGSVCTMSRTEPVLRYAAFPPQLGGAEDSATRVVIRADGCVSVTFRASSKYPGKHVLRLNSTEMEAFRHQMDRWQLDRIDTRQLRKSLAEDTKRRTSRDKNITVSAIRDEPLIRFELPSDAKTSQTILYPGIEQDWKNHPDNGHIQALHEAHDFVNQLITRVVLEIRGERP